MDVLKWWGIDMCLACGEKVNKYNIFHLYPYSNCFPSKLISTLHIIDQWTTILLTLLIFLHFVFDLNPTNNNVNNNNVNNNTKAKRSLFDK